MKISSLSKYTLGVVAAAGILAGCSSGAQTSGLGSGVTPAAGQHVSGSNFAAKAPLMHGQANVKIVPISPDKKKAKKYAYVSDSGANELFVYNFANGSFGTAVGSTSNVSQPQGLCALKTAVYLANTNDSQILVFKAPSTTSSSSLSTTGFFPVGCSVDSKGDVAVSNICTAPYCSPEGNVMIFKGGKGTPTTATCPNLARYYFLTYDKKGNIWVDGEDASYAFAFCEIPAGSTNGQAISLNVDPEFPGGVQIGGKNVTILDQDTNTVDEYTISGTSGTLSGSVALGGGISDPVGDWITKNGKYVLTANAGSANATSFAYPAGGNPVSTASGLVEPIGVAVAK
ncbi:MAG TPA: hypothetical protein VHX17_13375 [Candidatus Cybelea sp.]|nr:hypothetical protein [Candidatus Cybelea sp.]